MFITVITQAASTSRLREGPSGPPMDGFFSLGPAHPVAPSCPTRIGPASLSVTSLLVSRAHPLGTRIPGPVSTRPGSAHHICYPFASGPLPLHEPPSMLPCVGSRCCPHTHQTHRLHKHLALYLTMSRPVCCHASDLGAVDSHALTARSV
jgi:hypothetical protein